MSDEDRPDEDRPGAPGPKEPSRRGLTRRDVFLLILRTYSVSFPYILLFVLVLLVVTWVLTELIF